MEEMNKQNKRKQKNEKGFTMIELIIVVAIMGIIGAVLVPTFGNITNKARVSSDITTVKTLQRQFDVYRAEQGEYPQNFIPTTNPTTTKVTITSDILEELADKGYIDKKDLKATGTTPIYSVNLQTEGTLKALNGRCYIAISSTSKFKETATSDTNKDWFIVE